MSNNKRPVLLGAIIGIHFGARSWTESINRDANGVPACVHELLTFAELVLLQTHVHACTAGATVTRAAANSYRRNYGFSFCQSAFLLPRERVDRPLFLRFPRFPRWSYLRSCHTRAMKYHVTSRAPMMMRIALIVGMAVVHASPVEPLPSIILGGIGNVANTATNFRKSSSRCHSLDVAKFYLLLKYFIYLQKILANI